MKTKTFLVAYRYGGAEWNVELHAESFEDAQARLGQLTFGRVEGELIAKIPASLGPLAALAAFVQNAFSMFRRTA